MASETYQAELDFLSTQYTTTYGLLCGSALTYRLAQSKPLPGARPSLQTVVRQSAEKQVILSSLNVANGLLRSSQFPVDEESLDLVVTAILAHKKPKV